MKRYRPLLENLERMRKQEGSTRDEKRKQRVTE